MWIRGMFLIIFALFIDFLQAAVAWAAFVVGLGLQSVTPVGGAVGGAAVGAYACFNSAGSVIQSLVDAGKCAIAGGVGGALLSTFGIPFGSALGFALEIVISLTLGTAFIVTLILFRMYYPMQTAGGFLFELVPGLDILPGWTLMAILCVLKKKAEESSGIEGAALKITAAATSLSVANPVSAIRSANTIRTTANNVKSTPQPANDNKLHLPKVGGDIKPYVQKTA